MRVPQATSSQLAPSAGFLVGSYPILGVGLLFHNEASSTREVTTQDMVLSKKTKTGKGCPVIRVVPQATSQQLASSAGPPVGLI